MLWPAPLVLPMKLFDTLFIETIGACNRTCTTCLRQTYPQKPGNLPLLRTIQHKPGMHPDLMDEDLFKSIIDQSVQLGFKGRITLQFFNEPLLDPRLESLASYAKEKLPTVPLWICTNADLLTEERAKNLDKLFSRLNIALYMPKNRQKKRQKVLRSWFSNATLNFTNGVHLLTHFSPSKHREAMIRKAINQPCTTFNPILIVNWDGTVSHCCDDLNGDFQLGNLQTTSIKDVWFGARNTEITSKLSSPGGRQNFEYCKNCPRVDDGSAIDQQAIIPIVKQS